MDDDEHFKCDLCASVFLRKIDCERHRSSHTIERYRCFLCQLVFTNSLAFHKHQWTHEQQNLQEKSTSKWNAAAESEEIHPTGSLRFCDICHMLCRGLLALHVHRITHELSLNDNSGAPISEPPPAAGTREQKPLENPFISGFGQMSFHDSAAVDVDLFQQLLFEDQLFDERLFDQDMREIPPDGGGHQGALPQQLSSCESNMEDSRKYRCHICQMSFHTSPDLREHKKKEHPQLWTDANENIFECKTCHKILPDFLAFWDHHDKCKPFECEFCLLRFENEQLLQNHRVKHTGEASPMEHSHRGT